jgi:hypothetical protein
MFLEQRYVFLDDDTGMASPEAALLMLLGVTLAVIMIVIARSDWVRQALSDMVHHALDQPV